MNSQTKINKIDNIVYILGAGFSAPLNIPVMSNFLEKSKDMFAIEPDRFSKFANVFNTINKMHKSTSYYKTNLFNIEEILSILEMSEEVGSEKERSSFRDYIIDVIQYHTPKLEFKGFTPDWRTYAFDGTIFNYYGYFAGSLLNLTLAANNKMAPSQEDLFCNHTTESNWPARYSVVTLNYDMVLEDCFSYLVKNFHAEKKLGFSFEIEGEDSDFLKRTHLAKLHGSVDTKVIVPPTWNKGLHQDIKPAWKLAYKTLTEANHIRILGYSLPIADAYVKYLLKAAIINCEHLKNIDILCLDRGGDVKQRYDEFINFPNYRFRNGSIIDYLVDNHAQCLNNNPDVLSVRMNGLEATHKSFFD